MISVAVVDDQPLIRQAVRAILEAEADVCVVGEAATGAEAVQLARSTRPDVVVMDIRMPHTDGIAATQTICADPQLAHSRVLILTTFEDDDNVFAALRAGASGFIGKGAEPDDIVSAVRAVHAGDALLSAVATQALIRRALAAEPGALLGGAGEFTPSARAQQQLRELTAREREVLTLVGQGLSNDEIARQWVISPHTAKTHVNRIMMKLQLHDRAQLVILAYESGVISPGWHGAGDGTKPVHRE